MRISRSAQASLRTLLLIDWARESKGHQLRDYLKGIAGEHDERPQIYCHKKPRDPGCERNPKDAYRRTEIMRLLDEYSLCLFVSASAWEAENNRRGLEGKRPTLGGVFIAPRKGIVINRLFTNIATIKEPPGY